MKETNEHTNRLISIMETNGAVRNSAMDAVVTAKADVSPTQAIQGWLEAYARTHALDGVDVRSVSSTRIGYYLGFR